MNKTDFKISAILPVSQEKVFNAWLNGKEHGEMTGGEATGSAEIGAEFTAWDGYISGKNQELVPYQKITQTWRTTEFLEDDPDSIIEIYFTAADGGTRITLHHHNIPENQPDYESGWEEHYFDPMKEYFEG